MSVNLNNNHIECVTGDNFLEDSFDGIRPNYYAICVGFKELFSPTSIFNSRYSTPNDKNFNKNYPSLQNNQNFKNDVSKDSSRKYYEMIGTTKSYGGIFTMFCLNYVKTIDYIDYADDQNTVIHKKYRNNCDIGNLIKCLYGLKTLLHYESRGVLAIDISRPYASDAPQFLIEMINSAFYNVFSNVPYKILLFNNAEKLKNIALQQTLDDDLAANQKPATQSGDEADLPF